MEPERIKNLYISNLDFISYQSQEILQDHDSNILYSDFYKFYHGYVKHLQEVRWENNSIEEKVKRMPVIQKPNLLFSSFVVLFLPWLALVTPTLNFVTVAIYSLPLLVIFLPIYFFILRKRKNRLKEVINACSELKSELELGV